MYKPFAPIDIEQAVAGIRGLPIRGASVSMPFKSAVIPLVDEVLESAAAIDAVNTIVNDDGFLRAYNTDYIAVKELIKNMRVTPVILRGSGGMAKAVAAALKDSGFTDGLILARNREEGSRLASKLGWRWQSEIGSETAPLLVNVTPIGMEGTDQASDLSYLYPQISAAQTVFDVVAKPSDTPLIKMARDIGKSVVTGGEVIALQAAKQFEIYTAVKLTPELVAEARAFSQA